MLNQDYRDILQNFTDTNVEFLLVGAYALAKHGLVRATGDIDLFVRPTLENSKKIYKALALFGAPIEELTTDSFAQEGVIFQIGIVPRRVDIITQIDGITFDQCWQNREWIEFDELKVPIISAQDLYINKSSTGRTKDKSDAEWLEENLKRLKG